MYSYITLIRNGFYNALLCEAHQLPLFLQMLVPNFVKVYGSQYFVQKHFGDKIHRRTTIEVERSYLKALDQPSERCTDGKMALSTTTCIANFMEKQLGCSMTLHGSVPTMTEPCTSASQLIRLAKTTIRKLHEADSNTIYNVTGCLPSCEREEYDRIDVEHKEFPLDREPNDLKINYQIKAASYDEKARTSFFVRTHAAK